MSVVTAIANLSARIQDAYAALENKGAVMPATKDTYNLSSTILSISVAKQEQSKTVTPTAGGFIVTPDSNKVLSSVVINGDADLIAGNIKKDIQIFGVTGTYEGSGGGLQGYTLTVEDTSPGNGSSPIITAFHPDGTSETHVGAGVISDVTYFNAKIGSSSDSGTIYHGIYNVLLLSDTTIYFDSQCLLEGTKITLADGSEKNIEHITYDDELLVWDFDNGCLSTSKPIWIKKAQTENYWFENKYKSGKILKSVGKSETGWGHRVMDMTKGKFIYTTESIGDKVFTLDRLDLTESCQRMEGECKFYNIITKHHFNLFANRILTSCSLNNMYSIKEMKYVKDDRKLRTIEEYDGIPQQLFDGFRLSENMGDIKTLNKYVHSIMNKDSAS